MPTTLPRINLSVPKELNKIIFRLAKRDRVSVSKKTMELIEQAIEAEEDLELGRIAEERLKNKRRSVPFEKGWL
jgi:predicted DNA-binding protein